MATVKAQRVHELIRDDYRRNLYGVGKAACETIGVTPPPEHAAVFLSFYDSDDAEGVFVYDGIADESADYAVCYSPEFALTYYFGNENARSSEQQWHYEECDPEVRH